MTELSDWKRLELPKLLIAVKNSTLEAAASVVIKQNTLASGDLHPSADRDARAILSLRENENHTVERDS